MAALVVVASALGLGLRWASGHSFGELAKVHLRGEAPLLALLVVYSVLPAVSLPQAFSQAAYWVWLATYPVLIGLCWVNRRVSGMPAAALGLALNAAVVSANGGMPVSANAVSAVHAGAHLVIPPADFVHVLSTPSAVLPWLSDILPLAGPRWLAAVVSAGDCLLLVGIACFLALSGRHQAE